MRAYLILPVIALGIGILNLLVPAHAEIDHGRECLALVGFAEARNQSDAGMAAVMRVVLNRATDPLHRWPQTICSVVQQPGQFIGVENWDYPRAPKVSDYPAWIRAHEIADAVIAGTALIPDDCAKATHFDKGKNAHGLQSVCKLAAHTFYIDAPLIAENTK